MTIKKNVHYVTIGEFTQLAFTNVHQKIEIVRMIKIKKVVEQMDEDEFGYCHHDDTDEYHDCLDYMECEE